jgi:Na+-translocating ferredoxin:NAD+ oxidoreductase RnfE subunit
MSDQAILDAIAQLDKKLDVHITQASARCENCTEDVVDLKHTVFGNGHEGLKVSHTKLQTKVTVILAILAPIALMLVGLIIAWHQDEMKQRREENKPKRVHDVRL